MFTQGQSPLLTNPNQLHLQMPVDPSQMQYMPSSQFMTPDNYGAFRTIPNGQTFSFQQQAPGFFQSWLIRNRGSIFGLPAYTFNTYNPAVNQQLYMAQMQKYISDKTLSIGAGIGDFALSSLLTLPFGGPLNPLALAAGMLMPDMAAPLTNRVRDMRAIQNMTMSKIIGGPNADQSTGMGFNAASARSIDKFLRMSAANDVVLKEGDYRKLMELGVEYGMFDYANSANQYKDTLKKLRKSMTTMMEVLGSTDFKDIIKEFKRLQTMGANTNQFINIANKEEMFARMTGLSHNDLVNTYGQQGALMFSNMGLNAYQGSLQSMSNAAMVTMAQRTGMISPSELARMGGVSGMTQRMTQEDAGGVNKMKDYIMAYAMNENLTGLNPNAKLGDLLKGDIMAQIAQGATKLNDPTKLLNFQRHKEESAKELIDLLGVDNFNAINAIGLGKQVAPNSSFDTQIRAGYNLLGFSPETAEVKIKALTNGAMKEEAERQAAIARRKQREEEALANNPFRRFARAIDKKLTEFGENTYGRVARAYGNYVEEKTIRENGMLPGLNLPASNWNQVQPYLPTYTAELGEATAPFESGKNGIYQISWDKGGGTSYGKWQLASHKGYSYGTWLKYLEEQGNILSKSSNPEEQAKGKKYLELAKQLPSEDEANTGSTKGEAVNRYLQLAKENPEIFEKTQKEVLIKKNYNPLLEKIKAYSPETYNAIQNDIGLQEMAFSSAVQHGAGGAFNRVFKPVLRANPNIASSREKFIEAIYKQRTDAYHLPDRYTKEAQVILGMPKTRAGFTGGEEPTDIQERIADELNALTKNAIAKKVKYDLGARHSAQGAIDCSGWVIETGKEIVNRANAGGVEVFDKEAVRLLTGDDTAAGIIEKISKKTGNLYENNVLNPNAANSVFNDKNGIYYIGTDSERTPNSFRQIGHIVQVYFDKKRNDWFVNESTDSKKRSGPQESRLSDWWKTNKHKQMHAVDITELANPAVMSQSRAAAKKAQEKKIAKQKEQVEQVQKELDSQFAQIQEARKNAKPEATPYYINPDPTYKELATASEIVNLAAERTDVDVLSSITGILKDTYKVKDEDIKNNERLTITGIQEAARHIDKNDILKNEANLTKAAHKMLIDLFGGEKEVENNKDLQAKLQSAVNNSSYLRKLIGVAALQKDKDQPGSLFHRVKEVVTDEKEQDNKVIADQMKARANYVQRDDLFDSSDEDKRLKELTQKDPWSYKLSKLSEFAKVYGILASKSESEQINKTKGKLKTAIDILKKELNMSDEEYNRLYTTNVLKRGKDSQLKGTKDDKLLEELAQLGIKKGEKTLNGNEYYTPVDDFITRFKGSEDMPLPISVMAASGIGTSREWIDLQDKTGIKFEDLKTDIYGTKINDLYEKFVTKGEGSKATQELITKIQETWKKTGGYAQDKYWYLKIPTEDVNKNSAVDYGTPSYNIDQAAHPERQTANALFQYSSEALRTSGTSGAYNPVTNETMQKLSDAIDKLNSLLPEMQKVVVKAQNTR